MCLYGMGHICRIAGVLIYLMYARTYLYSMFACVRVGVRQEGVGE